MARQSSLITDPIEEPMKVSPAELGRGLTTADAERRLLEHGPNALTPAQAQHVAATAPQSVQERADLPAALCAGRRLDHLGARWGQSDPHRSAGRYGHIGTQRRPRTAARYRSERALEQLARLGAPKAWVMRDGVLSHLDVSKLVVGDVVRLDAGDRVPADGRAENATFMRVDESLLTGESLPVEKAEGDELFEWNAAPAGQ